MRLRFLTLRAAFVHAKLTGGAGLAIESPQRHVGLEGILKGRDELRKLVQGQAGQIQELGGVRLHIGEPDTRHETCLLLGNLSIKGTSYHKSA
jgi:hypothetical protein